MLAGTFGRRAVGMALAAAVLAGCRTGSEPAAEARAEPGERVGLRILLVGVDANPNRPSEDLARLRDLAFASPEAGARARTAREEIDGLVARLRAQDRVVFRAGPTAAMNVGSRTRLILPSAAGSELRVGIRTFDSSAPRAFVVEVTPEFVAPAQLTTPRWAQLEWSGTSLGFVSGRVTLTAGRTGGARLTRAVGRPVVPASLEVYLFVTASEPE